MINPLQLPSTCPPDLPLPPPSILPAPPQDPPTPPPPPPSRQSGPRALALDSAMGCPLETGRLRSIRLCFFVLFLLFFGGGIETCWGKSMFCLRKLDPTFSGNVGSFLAFACFGNSLPPFEKALIFWGIQRPKRSVKPFAAPINQFLGPKSAIGNPSRDLHESNPSSKTKPHFRLSGQKCPNRFETTINPTFEPVHFDVLGQVITLQTIISRPRTLTVTPKRNKPQLAIWL